MCLIVRRMGSVIWLISHNIKKLVGGFILLQWKCSSGETCECYVHVCVCVPVRPSCWTAKVTTPSWRRCLMFTWLSSKSANQKLLSGMSSLHSGLSSTRCVSTFTHAHMAWGITAVVNASSVKSNLMNIRCFVFLWMLICCSCCGTQPRIFSTTRTQQKWCFLLLCCHYQRFSLSLSLITSRQLKRSHCSADVSRLPGTMDANNQYSCFLFLLASLLSSSVIHILSKFFLSCVFLIYIFFITE